MALKLYNTLSRHKAEFVPIDPSNVRMYVCGPTVYDYAHIGNARPVIVFDVLFRLLRHIYGPDHVTYVRNITDVDDKINARAARDYPGLPLNEAIRKVTEATEKQFHTDIAALGVLQPTYEPRATEFIRRQDGREDMVSLIDALVRRGHAYVAENHVLFDVESMPDYGRLSNRTLEEMEAGARVEVAPYKKGPMDFVLWKPSKPGEPAWPSPSGIQVPGRPGWHIECSAMAGALLGPVFDIHGGGIDLTFPHHENEIAQSRCAHGTSVMANVWMHNGFLQVEGEKMSKSLGNFVTIHELLNTKKFGGRSWPGDVLRLAMLMTHYRQPINWTRTLIEESYSVLSGWKEVLKGLMSFQEGNREYYESEEIPPSFIDALADDVNTPRAISLLHAMAKESDAHTSAYRQLFVSGRLLGLWTFDSLAAEYKEEAERSVDIAPYVNRLINARLEARKRKDFAESDRIRDELAGMGIALKDTKNKETGEIETTWEIAR
ncbi:cysteine--tRNA ligase [Hyphomicrobium sp. 2TAF46]|uniref:cysteine--tRNA ligase n=1 Tax=Hyphomicrobium sp. 2TAF46 TaxID=3233019 RepID=UPI003F91CCF7